MELTDSQRAQRVKDRRDWSHRWMRDNFYEQWVEVFRAYKCEAELKLDDKGKEDPTQTALTMPDTHGYTRRCVARLTAQIPNLKYRAKEEQLAQLISRTLMYQWDHGGIQRREWKHTLQAVLFGWSVRAWYWSHREAKTTRYLDAAEAFTNPTLLQLVANEYKVDIAELTDQTNGPGRLAELVATKGRGVTLPVKQEYVAYSGPACEFLFAGDCYPEPNLESIQSSRWFIVERRRNGEWLRKLKKRYPEELGKGIAALEQKYPKGTNPSWFAGARAGSATESLQTMLSAAIDRTQTDLTPEDPEGTDTWTILEEHSPGPEAKLRYVGENDIWIGEIDYPYNLEGRIAFTERVLMEDLLCGIGDSTPRIIRGLQALHDRQNCTRFDLVGNILRPLYRTSDALLYERPELLVRGKGYRLIFARRGDLEVLGEQAAIAHVAVGMQDETGIMRLLQTATGETNLSMAAGVDPQQARTARGATLMARAQDSLTGDLLRQHNESIRQDGEIMLLLNRSEFGEPQELETSRYRRDYTADQDPVAQEWIRIGPEHFQTQGEVTAELNSTLADDDEANVAKATAIFQAATARPDLFNQEMARDRFLISMGEGKNLPQWKPKPLPPPPPPEVRSTLNVAAKWEALSREERQAILEKGGVISRAAPGGPPGGPGTPPGGPMGPAGPLGPGPGPPGGGPPAMPLSGPGGPGPPRPQAQPMGPIGPGGPR